MGKGKKKVGREKGVLRREWIVSMNNWCGMMMMMMQLKL